MTREQAIQDHIGRLEYIREHAEQVYSSLVMAAGAIGHLPDGFEDWDERAPKGVLLTVAGSVGLLCKMLSELPDDTYRVIHTLEAAPISAANGKGGAAK